MLCKKNNTVYYLILNSVFYDKDFFNWMLYILLTSIQFISDVTTVSPFKLLHDVSRYAKYIIM